MPAIATIEQLQELLRGQGVRTAYVKHLSPKQDNEKNQIYLGGGLDGVTNLFPATIEVRSASASLTKRRSSAGKPKLEARLDFAWLDADGTRHNAQQTRIIDYFQYPEVRMSGFLNRCEQGPPALRRRLLGDYGRRILVMGTAADGKVIGLVLTERDDPVVAELPELPLVGEKGVLGVLSIDGEVGTDPAELLRHELEAIVRGGWHWSRINRAGVIGAFTGAQGGGYTLEALLGVAANGNKAPDKHGFEIKSFSGSRISLMTPAPDRGFQGDHTFREFMECYGHPAVNEDGSVRFTGLHKVGVINAKTGLGMRVAGYDRATDSFGDAATIAVEMFNPLSGEIAAAWSLEKLANCWNAKHANALYITFESRADPDGKAEYRFAPRWLQGKGTDVWRLLRAIDRGIVFYDPADTIYADNRPKNRPQWRINSSQLEAAMKVLYAQTTAVTVAVAPIET